MSWDERRNKLIRVRLPGLKLAAILNTGLHLIGLPEDTTIERVKDCDNSHDMWDIILSSDEFRTVGRGAVIPEKGYSYEALEVFWR